MVMDTKVKTLPHGPPAWWEGRDGERPNSIRSGKGAPPTIPRGGECLAENT